MLKPSLCNYIDAYILLKGTIPVRNTAASDDNANNANKKVIFKNCALFINCINEINNTQVDNAKDIDIVMSMYNLIEYSDNCSKTSGSLWQYYKDIPAVYNDGNIVEFNGGNATDPFNFKVKITGETGNNGTKLVEIMVLFKHLNYFWRALEMLLINCEISLMLTWSANYVIVYTDAASQGVKSGFKRIINWNKHL